MLVKDLRYNVIVMPDSRSGTNEPCYSVQCPGLGLADEGETIEEALENIKKLITFHVKSLVSEGETVESESDDRTMLTSVHVSYGTS